MTPFAYRTAETPLGQLLLASTDQGLVRLGLPGLDHAQVLADLRKQLGSPGTPDDPAAPHLARAADELAEYFAGQRTEFTVPVDLRLTTGFRRNVLEQMREIAYGSVVSYKQLAIDAGSPNAVRAVGTACAQNPLPIVVPCHRVRRTDGGLGGYLGGLDAKRWLLKLEGQDQALAAG